MSLPATAQTAATEFLTDEQRWLALLSRTPAADGQFVYAVRTTGVFCRPNCSSRRPLRHNVRFFESSAGALRAGFRACRRCLPTAEDVSSRQSDLIQQACRLIEGEIPDGNLQQLAQKLDISPFHFHRRFKAATGLTPKRYAIARRKDSPKTFLQDFPAIPVTASLMNDQPSVRQTSSEASHQPTIDGPLRYAMGACWLGSLLVTATNRGICAISLGSSPSQLLSDLQVQFPDQELLGGDTKVENWVVRVVGFLEEPGQSLDLPLAVQGTAFQRRVWDALRTIPFGSTVTYMELANRIGAPSAVRAVASACAANQIAIAIPCHRVVRSDGSLSGFRWGVDRKAGLLKWESIAATARLTQGTPQKP